VSAGGAAKGGVLPAMTDDWRVELEVEEHGGLRHLVDAAREHLIARDAGHRLGEDVIVTVDANRLFAYVGSEEQAAEAARMLRDGAAARGLSASVTIARWHRDEGRWEPTATPLPGTTPEHETRHQQERAERR
jgi:hypothetical protein